MASQRGETTDKCGKCNKATGCDSWLSCEICDGWFHSKCVNVTEEAYKVLHELDTCHWYCLECNNKMGKFIPNIVRLSDRVAEIDSKIVKLESDLSTCNANVVKVKEKVDEKTSAIDKRIIQLEKEVNKINGKFGDLDATFHRTVEYKLSTEIEKNAEKQKASFRDIMKQQMEEEVKKNLLEHESKFSEVSDNLALVKDIITETKSTAIEEKDKEERRNNIIIYRVPESSGDGPGDRMQKDIRVCLSFFNQLQTGVSDEDIVKVIRLGKYDPSATDPRPLLVKMSDRHSKNLVMENLYKLKSASAEVQNYIVAHDMTKKERDECKQLVTEAKHKTLQETSGDWRYVVRGNPGMMKIVRLRKRN